MTRAVQVGALLTYIALSQTPLIGQDSTITVRLVNGMNGKPIADENLNVWVNDAKGSQLFRPDRDGIIKLRVGSDDALSFASNVEVTCHPYRKDQHSLPKYRVSEILAHGIADDNSCSKNVRVAARPGEFVFYERPRTFLEWWRL